MILDAQFVQDYLIGLSAIIAGSFGTSLLLWLIVYAISSVYKWIVRNVI